MKTVLLPVKDFKKAKQRLESALDPTSRAGLARAMLKDVLDALSRTHSVQRVVVFTACNEVMELAQPLGFEVVVERSVEGHSHAVNTMVSDMSPTCSRILSLAADLPCLAPAEVDFALDAASEPITLIPSRDWTGTNGVIFMPPAHIAMEYGSGSFRRHLSKADAAGIPADVMNLPGFAFDIDTPSDLQAFIEDPRTDSQTWEYLRACGVGGHIASATARSLR